MKQYAVIVHEALKESGINFVAYLPDDQIHDAQKLITEDKDFTTVGVTNEGEAVAACAGAWLGGAKPALLIADSEGRPRVRSLPLLFDWTSHTQLRSSNLPMKRMIQVVLVSAVQNVPVV